MVVGDDTLLGGAVSHWIQRMVITAVVAQSHLTAATNGGVRAGPDERGTRTGSK